MIKSLRQRISNRSYLGWQQLSRNPVRFLVALAGVAVAVILMFVQMGVQGALIDANTRIHAQLEADIVVIHKFARDILLLPTISRRQLTQLQAVPGVADVNTLYIGRIGWRHPDTRRPTDVTLIGQNPLKPGVGLIDNPRDLARLQRLNTLALDVNTRGDYQDILRLLQDNQPVPTEIGQNTVTIVTTFRLGAAFATDGTLISSQETFLQLNPQLSVGEVNLGLLRVAEGYDTEAVLQAIQARLPTDMQALTRTGFIDFEKNYLNTVSPVGIIFGFGTAVAIVIGIVFVFQILSDDVNEHIIDYATLKAMGYRDRFLLGVILEESLLLAVFGFIPASFLSVFYYRLLSLAAAIPVAMTLERVVLVFCLTLFMCAASGIIATRRLRTADPADIF